MAPFFSNAEANGFEPKRQFRFLVSFSQFSNLQLMATKAEKPSYEISGVTEHRVLNHTFKFPGVVTWKDVKITFIDAMDPNTGSKFWNALQNAGYIPPTEASSLATGVTKISSTAALGQVKIQQLDGGSILLPGDGDAQFTTAGSTNIREEWVLKNAFIKGVNWGALDYGTDDIVNIEVDLTYDFAQYNVMNSAAQGLAQA